METNNEYIERRINKTYLCICGEGFGLNQFSIQCDNCKEWFHGFCVGLNELKAEELDKFYCKQCFQFNNRLVSTRKPVTNNWRHNKTEANATTKAVQSGTEAFVINLKNMKFTDAKTDDSVVKRMRGQLLTFKELLLNGFNIPILVESKDGLEMTVPSNTWFSYRSLLDYYPCDYELEVVDVTRQINTKLSAKDLVNSLSVDYDKRHNVYNCLSLEISNNELISKLIRAPNIVNKLSWVDNYWPAVDTRPSVSKYFIISMKDSFTDFHIDFGGTSVWYHVLNGEKIFYILKPTKENIEQYEQWMSANNTNELFFADMVGRHQCFILNLSAGQTLFIPTGWIHAVLTPQDSVVFGGNFLHSFNIELQLKIREMEQRIKTPSKFQFPFFELTHWYAAPNVLKLLQDSLKQNPPKHLVTGVTALIPQLKVWYKKSKDYQNQNDYQSSTLAPKGFNCIKLIKDLNLTLKKANRKLEGHPLVKKRGKSYKSFNLEPNESLPISSAAKNVNTPEKKGQKRTKSTDNSDKESQMELDEDRDQSLVVDDQLKEVLNPVTHSTDPDSKGSLKLKLSISGAKEILGTNEFDFNQFDSSDIMSLESRVTDSLFPSLKSSVNQNIETSKKQKNKKKRKKTSNSEQFDDEIESMVKGRPEDDDFIYLDLETPDEEDIKNKLKTNIRDESWAPKAKVTIKATPKAPRLPRDNAKRDVVETSIANAAAKLENWSQPKRAYNRKKQKVLKTSLSSDKTDSANTGLTLNTTIATTTTLSTSTTTTTTTTTMGNTDSSGITSIASNSGSSPVVVNPTGGLNSSSKASQLIRKPKKGLKTAKQRLHKIICQKKRMHF